MNVIDTQSLDISSLTKALSAGQTIVYPTETCYGLGCDATNQSAVDTIFDIKKRQRNKPVLVVVHDLSVMLEHVFDSRTLFEIEEKYWPGPLTVVTKARPDSTLAKGVIAEDGTVAFRITEHPIAKALCKAIDGPLVSTSANISTHESPYDIKDVLAMFEHQLVQPDIVIDGGKLPHESPSTIVRIHEDGTLEVLREGELVLFS
ncbi:MAG: threonylcarbamoyl-AMP synthase [Candidatus Magasanikbacteria bacterium CG_4_9_14_0_2_um_filter_42_11]|uniref:L-threonylcarbamoyladenylate synthase n=1 Tax=Candidatus Magasanikbacteria bacterium CG_4_9_14_0_2_um_filter_42_11 TaxID=1974643 RepID=A0A2M8FB23_9BACT|nr:MAG: threonylcarbamoyl-AMP synthase [Candidatus Magasanikbacteria bacterium CG10_big_fil_rev_8_21_14_0_10_43_9]PIY92177.1 MAG: threonylcarbamoyl-AMP synthase [Candidatus Magasanikbacteria bacterium CG_4_10_14_0_8_um_filter_42_12]PJC52935.1 MAG: threonylcarbamoyl-AMP synthase [Candidatus Magasanikbacteria bacterium CG_4_9_14_0_2_um_filter_42_11]